jgi:hypothetical protein
VTIAVLVWLFRHHPGRYGAARLVLFATTAIALVGFYLYPLAPPRLMAGVDFIDTGLVHNTWGSLSSESMQSVSNQYAAMPSMHIGWSVWCGIIIVLLARPLWLKTLGALYPVATLFVIVATANHFWLDAVGGLICLAFGFLVAWIWYGRLCYRLPQTLQPEALVRPSCERAGPVVVDPDMRINVSADFTGRTDTGKAVYELHERPLRPRPGTILPATEHIQWHTRQVFKTPALGASR